MDRDFYSIKEFSIKLGLSEKTIRRQIKKGLIMGFRIGESEKSSYRIPHSEIYRIADKDIRKTLEGLK